MVLLRFKPHLLATGYCLRRTVNSKFMVQPEELADPQKDLIPPGAAEGGDVQLFSISETQDRPLYSLAFLAFHRGLSDVQGMQDQLCHLRYCVCHLLVS